MVKKTGLIFFLLLGLGIFGCGKETMSLKNLTIITGSEKGTYYPVGLGIKKVLEKEYPDLEVLVKKSRGSVENVHQINKGKVQLAISQVDVAFYAYEGKERFKGKPHKNLRGLTALYAETVQIVTLKADKYRSIYDLKGKTIGLGELGSGSRINAKQILTTCGIIDSITEINCGFEDASKKLLSGKIDAFFYTAGIPTKGIIELNKKKPIKLIKLSNSDLKKLLKKYPYYSQKLVSPRTYKNQGKRPILAAAIKAVLLVDSKVSEVDAKLLFKAIKNNMGLLKSVHPRIKDLELELIYNEELPFPKHPGALAIK
ncbi:TAXI family TRAP transporter solute-binding subunit [Candidatus Riflebacteria bacterium]